jgi:hypothetical protein
MVLSWNLTAEHGFKQDWMLRIAYVGNSGHHLSGTGDQESGLAGIESRYLYGNNPLTGSEFHSWQRSPTLYPAYGSIASINSGVEQQLQRRPDNLEKRMTHGFSFLTNFTWAKELDDFRPDRRVAIFNQHLQLRSRVRLWSLG